MFIFGMIGIGKRDCEWITEYRCGFMKGSAMFLGIGSGFSLIPIEFHHINLVLLSS